MTKTTVSKRTKVLEDAAEKELAKMKAAPPAKPVVKELSVAQTIAFLLDGIDHMKNNGYSWEHIATQLKANLGIEINEATLKSSVSRAKKAKKANAATDPATTEPAAIN